MYPELALSTSSYLLAVDFVIRRKTFCLSGLVIYVLSGEWVMLSDDPAEYLSVLKNI
jgi:hypothetical protein